MVSIEYFHEYLYGKLFSANTDHLPLTWLQTKKNVHPRLERWLLRLSLYEFEINYKPGKENIVADGLSRLPDEEEINRDQNDDYFDTLIANIDEININEQTYSSSSNNSSEEFSSNSDTEVSKQNIVDFTSLNDEQNKDPDIKWIINLIKTNGKNKPKIDLFENLNRRVFFKEYNNLRLIDDSLFKINLNKEGNYDLQFVLPKQCEEKIIKHIHSSVFNAHLGREKTKQKILARFYRAFLSKNIKLIVKQCDVCQRVKNSKQTNNSKLIPIRTYQTNELITTDFAGPFKKTSRGNVHFQIVIDHFSKYAEFKPVKNTKANTAADVIVNDWCCRYGIPHGILSDQGTQYQSKLLDLVYDHLDIKRLKTTPFHPQCDGQSERTVQTLKNMIKCYVDENQESWDLDFQKYAFAYNSSVHCITNQTPFEMMFGRKPRIPIDILIPNSFEQNREPIKFSSKQTNELGLVEILADEEPTENNIPEEAKIYLNNLKQKLTNSFEIAKLNRNIRMDKVKIDHERRLRKFDYKIGDLVLTDHPKLKRGLLQGIARKYYRLFEIVGKNLNGVDFFIKKVGSKRGKIKQYHKSRLKIYYYSKPELN